MSCTNCNSSLPNTITLSYSSDSSCSEDSNCPNISASCIKFNAPNLPCSGINTGDSLELSIQKIDEKICATAGDYSTYNFHCLDDITPITSESEFVSAITDYICTLNSSLTDFTGVSFVNYQGTVNDRFTTIESPGIVCTSASVVGTDTLSQVLNKYCTKFSSLDTAIALTGINWSECFTVTTAPSTISEAFSLVVDQICQTKALITSSTLPTFDNTASCLSTPGSSDSLVDTISKIKTRLCQSPTLDNTTLTSACISVPATATDLQTLLQNMLTKLDTLTSNFPSFSADFTVTGTGCNGKTIALATPIDQDRFVAANAADTTPGTLISKLVGVGCTIDDTTNTGQVTITVTSSSVSDGKVKADSSDATADYLINKVEAGASVSGIGLNVSYNATNQKVKVAPTVDPESILDLLLTYLEENPDSEIANRLCSIISSCPSPCEGPTNVMAVAVSGDTTTSTTTTTTTTV